MESRLYLLAYVAVGWFQVVKCQTDYCTPNPCSFNGTCYNLPSAYSCVCTTGYGGSDCSQTGIDYCANYNCINGGTCSTSNGAALCLCVGGYTDPICGTDYNDCANTPCLNGGTCVDGLSTFTCNCPSGYSGNYCELGPDPCSPNPCLNGGSCAASGSTYTCSCATGFSGNICQTGTATTPCDSNPCFNGGVCNNVGASYTCTSCSGDYTGPSCNILQQCPVNFALTNGWCSNVLTSGYTDFFGANAWCLALGSSLPVGKLSTDWPIYSAFMGGLGVTSTWYGLVYNTATKTFAWSDGTPLGGTTNWAAGSPGTLGSSPLCVYTSSSGFQWSTTSNCSSTYPAVCLSPAALNHCGSSPCKNGGTCYTTATGYQCVCPTGVIGSNCEQPNFGYSWVYQTCDALLQCDTNSASVCGPGDYCVCPGGKLFDFTNNICVPTGTVTSTLAPSCATNADCNGVFSATCVGGVCTCPNGMLALNNICPPATLFNINDGCINTSLVFYPAENLCRLPYLNEPCPTGLCITSGMTCAANGICTAPGYNQTCNGLCADPWATCQNGICQCQQFFTYSQTLQQCVEVPQNPGLTCSPLNNLCNNTVLGNVTVVVTCDTTMLCQCPLGYSVVNNLCAVAKACPGDSCLQGQICQGKSACSNGICQCPLGKAWVPGMWGQCGACSQISCPTIYNPISKTNVTKTALTEFKLNCSIDLQTVGKISQTCDYTGTWGSNMDLCVPNNVEDLATYSDTTLPNFSNDPDTFMYLIQTFMGRTDANSKTCLNLYLASDPNYLVQATMNILANSPIENGVTLTETQLLSFIHTMLDFFDFALTGENGDTIHSDPVSAAKFMQAIDAFNQLIMYPLNNMYGKGNRPTCGDWLHEYEGKAYTWNYLMSQDFSTYTTVVRRNRTAGNIDVSTTQSLNPIATATSIAGVVYDVDLNPIATTTQPPWGKHFEILPHLISRTTSYQLSGIANPVVQDITFTTPTPLDISDVTCVTVNSLMTSTADLFSTTGCWVSSVVSVVVTCHCTQAGLIGLIMLIDDPTIVTTYTDDYIEPIQVLGLIISCVCLLVAIGYLFYIRKLVSLRIFILRNACFDLLIGQFIFLLSRAISDQQSPCRAFAFMTQYFFNAFSTWILLLGISFVVILAIGYKVSILTSERRHRRTLFLVGYGVPLIILGITGGISYKEFGTPGFCFLSLANWLPLSFIVPLMTAASFNVPVCLATAVYYWLKRKILNPKLLYWAVIRGNVKFLAAMFPAMLAWGVAAVCQFSDPLDKASAYCNVVFGFLTGIVLMVAVVWLNNEVKEGVLRQRYKKPIQTAEDMEQLLEADQYHY